MANGKSSGKVTASGIMHRPAAIHIEGNKNEPTITYTSREGYKDIGLQKNMLFTKRDFKNHLMRKYTPSTTWKRDDTLVNLPEATLSHRHRISTVQSCPSQLEFNENVSFNFDDALTERSRPTTQNGKKVGPKKLGRPLLINRLSNEATEVMLQIKKEMEERATNNRPRTVKVIVDKGKNNINNVNKSGLVEHGCIKTNKEAGERRSNQLKESKEYAICDFNGSARNSTTILEKETTTGSENKAKIENEQYNIILNQNIGEKNRRDSAKYKNATLSNNYRMKEIWCRSQKLTNLSLSPKIVGGEKKTGKINFKARKMEEDIIEEPGEYNENRNYRKITRQVWHKPRRVETIKPFQPVCREKSFQITGPGYDSRIQQPWTCYNSVDSTQTSTSSLTDSIEKRIHKEAIEKCRKWIDKWII